MNLWQLIGIPKDETNFFLEKVICGTRYDFPSPLSLPTRIDDVLVNDLMRNR
jgi:hypothetical protein